jgi:hypothetical protein
MCVNRSSFFANDTEVVIVTLTCGDAGLLIAASEGSANVKSIQVNYRLITGHASLRESYSQDPQATRCDGS